MTHRLVAGSLAIALTTALSASCTGSGQAPASNAQGAALRTPWGEPDLQGIWTDEFDTPMQRPAKYADREFFTDEERTQLDRERAGLLGRDKRVERGTELDVAGAYNATFLSVKRTGTRTSLVVDPPDGRIPALTREAQARAQEDREFRLALIQSTATCKQGIAGCRGGTYDPRPSKRRDELTPRYNVGRMNRFDGPEDGGLGDRCLLGRLPDFPTAFGGSFRRIVQSPGGVTIYYDTGQGQGFQRGIVMNGSPHLPPQVRQWLGDSRGRWEGDTLVVDVTNFSPKADFNGSRENLHMVERWRRAGPTTLDYSVTIEDPTVWTRSWTVKQEFTKQSNEANRIYYEPRCHEGNYAFAALLLNQRLAEKAHAEGKGPHPATLDNATDFVGVEESPF
jgi:hypothetical protein